jgi:hypothetical protein
MPASYPEAVGVSRSASSLVVKRLSFRDALDLDRDRIERLFHPLETRAEPRGQRRLPGLALDASGVRFGDRDDDRRQRPS